ncbi:MAG: hypothetical protein ACQETD_07400 [Pseudomonadota bacterium]
MVDNPTKSCGNAVKDDLNKAEQEWANRSLFKQPRRRGRWLWLVVLAVVVVALMQYREQLLNFF